MAVTAVLAAIFIYFLFLTALSPVVSRHQDVERRLSALSKQEGTEASDLSRPFSERFLRPAFDKIVRAVAQVAAPDHSAATDKLNRQLRQAGLSTRPGEYRAIQLICLLLFSCAGTAGVLLFPGALPTRLLILLICVLLGLLIPDYALRSAAKRRQGKIRAEMPELLDLLSVSVEAGLSFDAALLRVCDHFSGALSDELRAVHREIRMGRPRREAFQNLNDRCGVEEIRAFTGALAQADQLGIPMRNVLHAQAEKMRLRRRQIAQEKGMKAPVKMMIPMVLFIFPVIFIILLAPSVIKIMSIFK